MNVKLLNFWENLRSTYWFIPSLLTARAIALAAVTLQLDQYFLRQPDQSLTRFYAGGADGALSLLSTVAGSMITVAGVTFSITIVALTLASSQFGPRLLNNFIARPRQSDCPGHIHRHLRLLPARYANGSQRQ